MPTISKNITNDFYVWFEDRVNVLSTTTNVTRTSVGLVSEKKAFDFLNILRLFLTFSHISVRFYRNYFYLFWTKCFVQFSNSDLLLVAFKLNCFFFIFFCLMTFKLNVFLLGVSWFNIHTQHSAFYVNWQCVWIPRQTKCLSYLDIISVQ